MSSSTALMCCVWDEMLLLEVNNWHLPCGTINYLRFFLSELLSLEHWENYWINKWLNSAWRFYFNHQFVFLMDNFQRWKVFMQLLSVCITFLTAFNLLRIIKFNGNTCVYVEPHDDFEKHTSGPLLHSFKPWMSQKGSAFQFSFVICTLNSSLKVWSCTDIICKL